MRMKKASRMMEEAKGNTVLPMVTPGGAGGIRTPYLLTASQTFSQVNYGPRDNLFNLTEKTKRRKLATGG